MGKPLSRHYVGPLDLVRSAPLVAFSSAKALSKITRGDALIRVQRTLDHTMQIFKSDVTTGLIDKAAVDAFIGTRSLSRTATSSPAFSDMVTMDNATGINIGMSVTGPGIGYGTVVRSITNAPTIQLTQRPALSAAPITFTDVGGIETSFDQSGNANHAVQADIVQQPVWVSDFGVGGMSTNTKFSPQERGGILATSNSITIPGGKFSLFALAAFEDTGYGSQTPLIGIEGMSAEAFSVFLSANRFGRSGISHEMYDGTNYGEWESADTGVMPYETPLVVNLNFNSQGNSSSFLGNAEYGYGGDNIPIGTITGRLAIGSNDASLYAVSFKGDMGDVILYDDIVSPHDAAEVRKAMS